MRRAIPTVAACLLLVGALVQACRSRVPHDEGETFALVGLHAALSCEQCHTNGSFGPLDPACASCHEVDRPGADHYPGQDCGDCHTAYGWLVFTEPTGEVHPCVADHDSCLPLVDAHALDCASCHEVAGEYAGLDPACASCHEADRPPYHYVGQDCASCHLPTAWEDGEEHPIRLPHADAACESCHVDPADRARYTCVDGGCHGEAETAQAHQNVYGYAWQSPRCVECHPDGTL